MYYVSMHICPHMPRYPYYYMDKILTARDSHPVFLFSYLTE